MALSLRQVHPTVSTTATGPVFESRRLPQMVRLVSESSKDSEPQLVSKGFQSLSSRHGGRCLPVSWKAAREGVLG